MASDKAIKRQVRVASERLWDVLQRDFCGNKELMAYAAGVSVQTLYNWLNARKGVPRVGKLAALLPYSEDWLNGSSDDSYAEVRDWRKKDMAEMTASDIHNYFIYQVMLARKAMLKGGSK